MPRNDTNAADELAHYDHHVRLAILAHRASDEAERLRRELAAAELAAAAAWHLVHEAWPAVSDADGRGTLRQCEDMAGHHAAAGELTLEPFTPWAPPMPAVASDDLVLMPLD